MSEATETQPAAELAARFLPLKWWQAGLLVLGAAGCFHAAYTPAKPGPLALLIVGYVVCLVQLARMRTRPADASASPRAGPDSPHSPR